MTNVSQQKENGTKQKMANEPQNGNAKKRSQKVQVHNKEMKRWPMCHMFWYKEYRKNDAIVSEISGKRFDIAPCH